MATEQETAKTEAINEEEEKQDDFATLETDETEENKVVEVEKTTIVDETIENEVIFNEEETELITEIEPNNTTIAEKENSPGFFSRLFGNDDQQKTKEDVDAIALQTTNEIKEVESVNDEEIVTTETKTASAEEIVEEPIETFELASNEESGLIADIEISEPAIEEESPGFFSRLFGSSDENTETIALADSETIESTTEIETTVNEELAENVPTLSEIDRIRSLATQGDADAQYQLGTLYYASNDVKQDYIQAALWYRRAAQQGNIDAQYSLGNM